MITSVPGLVHSTVPSAAVWLPLLASGAFLASLGLIVFKPFSAGLWGTLVGLVALAAVPVLGGFLPSPLLGLAVLWVAAGLSSSWWTEKLGLTYVATTQSLAMGMLLGGMAIPVLFGPLLASFGVPPLAFGFVGAWVGGSLGAARQGRKPQAAMRLGLAALVSSLGPRGLQLVAALLAIDAAMGLGPLGGAGGLHVAAP